MFARFDDGIKCGSSNAGISGFWTNERPKEMPVLSVPTAPNDSDICVV
jgi:hypothetical protein